jgi:hypothetical protein
MAIKKLIGQQMYLKEPHFPSYGGNEIYGSSYAADQATVIDQYKHYSTIAIAELEKRYDESRMNYDYACAEYSEMRHAIALAKLAPSRKDLEDYPALKAAWDQYVTVRKLVKGE